MFRLLTLLILTFTAGACCELGRGDPKRKVDAGAETALETTDPTGEAIDGSGDAMNETGPDIELPPASFAAGVHAVLLDNCTDSGCHSAGVGGYLISGNIDADYAATLNLVVPGNALGSKLVQKATNTSSHTGGPVLEVGTAEYELVVAWINGGALP